MAAKDIQVQIANVDLRKKPAYLVEDGGQVPILETSDVKIVGSDNIINFALEKTSGIDLLPNEEESRQQLRDYIDRIDKKQLIGVEWKAAVFGGEENVQKFAEMFDEIEQELSKNDEGNKFFNNKNEITFADIILAPPIVRGYFAIQERLSTVESLTIERYPNIGTYVESIVSHPIIGPQVTNKIGYLNYWIERNANANYSLPYPQDLTPLADSQSFKKLYVLNGFTAKPLTNKNHVRIYGHPLCPFVERALLAFEAKEIPYQFWGIDLTTKNQWHLDINGGLVPFIELPDGKIIIESLDVSEWAQNNSDKGVNLFPDDESNKEAIKQSVATLFKSAINIILTVFLKDQRDGEGDKKYVESIQQLNDELIKSDTLYFGGFEHETMSDLMTFPFLHRAFLVEHWELKEKYFDKINFDSISKLKQWYDTLAEKYKKSIAIPIDFKTHLEKNILQRMELKSSYSIQSLLNNNFLMKFQ